MTRRGLAKSHLTSREPGDPPLASDSLFLLGEAPVIVPWLLVLAFPRLPFSPATFAEPLA